MKGFKLSFTVIFLLGLFISNTTAQRPLGSIVVSSASPSQIILKAEPDSGNYAILTLFGSGLDQIRKVRVVKGAAVEPGVSIRRIRIDSLTKGKELRLKQYDDSVMAIYQLKPTAKLTKDGLEFQVYDGVKWQPIATKITVHSPRSSVAVRNSIKRPAAIGAIDSQPKVFVGKDDKFERELVQAAIKNPIQENFESGIKPGAMDRAYPTAKILDYYPKEVGQIDGTIVIIGYNLDSIVSIRIGNKVLSRKPIKKFSVGGQQKYVYFTGYEPLAGKLIVVKPIKYGNALFSIEQALTDDYRLVNRNEMQPVLRVESVRPLSGNDTLIYPYQRFRARLRIENVPGNYINSEEIGLSKGGKISRNGEFQVVSDEVFRENNYVFYGNTLFISFNDISTTEQWYTATFELRLHDLYKSDFTRVKQFPISFALAPSVRYVLEDTYSLEAAFQFKQCYSWGITEGTSYGANLLSSEDDVSVGFFKKNNDLTFRIASGLIGTQSVWVSQAVKLKDGWSLEAINFDVHRVSPDNSTKTHVPGEGRNIIYSLSVPIAAESFNGIAFAGGGDFSRSINIPWYARPGTFDDDLMFSIDRIVTDCEGEVYSNEELAPGVAGAGLFVRPILVDLEAEATLINDHRITFTIDKLVLKGPPGRNPQSAFSSAYYGQAVDYWIVKDCHDQDIIPVKIY